MTIATALGSISPASGTRQLSIAVFCGASSATGDAVDVTRELGQLIGQAGYRLIYGGGGRGLMGELAWSAHRHGGTILGVVPEFLYERELHIAAPPQEIRITGTMPERKNIMLDEADAFIALPGGYGTLDEILDVISYTYLGVHNKPLVLVEPDGEWGGFISVLGELVARGYARPIPAHLISVVSTAAAALQAVAQVAEAGAAALLA